VELWDLSYFVCPQKWQRYRLLGVRVVLQHPVLGYTWGFPMSKEGDMVEEPSEVDEDAIQGW